MSGFGKPHKRTNFLNVSKYTSISTAHVIYIEFICKLRVWQTRTSVSAKLKVDKNILIKEVAKNM